MVLEAVLLSQDFIRIVVQAILVVHEAGEGRLKWSMLHVINLLASLMHSSMRETPAKGSTEPDSTPDAITVASLDHETIKNYSKQSTSEHKRASVREGLVFFSFPMTHRLK